MKGSSVVCFAGSLGVTAADGLSLSRHGRLPVCGSDLKDFLSTVSDADMPHVAVLCVCMYLRVLVCGGWHQEVSMYVLVVNFIQIPDS